MKPYRNLRVLLAKVIELRFFLVFHKGSRHTDLEIFMSDVYINYTSNTSYMSGIYLWGLWFMPMIKINVYSLVVHVLWKKRLYKGRERFLKKEIDNGSWCIPIGAVLFYEWIGIMGKKESWNLNGMDVEYNFKCNFLKKSYKCFIHLKKQLVFLQFSKKNIFNEHEDKRWYNMQQLEKIMVTQTFSGNNYQDNLLQNQSFSAFPDFLWVSFTKTHMPTEYHIY